MLKDEFEEPTTVRVKFPDGEKDVPAYYDLGTDNHVYPTQFPELTPCDVDGYIFERTSYGWVAFTETK